MKIMICTRCKDYGRPARKARGSNGLAIAAWLVFPFGLPYTIWRMFSKIPVCKQCQSTELVDAESMVGIRLMAAMIGEEIPPESTQESPQAVSSVPVLSPDRRVDAPMLEAVDENQMEFTLDAAPKLDATPKVVEPIVEATDQPVTERKKRQQDPDVW